ncbi:MAG: hypothetical protein VST68_09395 [Nitrospirota bacterium]|nr:hypothetical protein [Nitrospirota bacterium]
MSDSDQNPENSGRKGLHPALVLFGIILGLWLFVQAIIPKSKHIQPPQGYEAQTPQTAALLKEGGSAVVPTFKLTATVPNMNALAILVPQQTTESQVIALVNHLHETRKDGTLANVLPPTTPHNDLDQFSVANMYIFSDPEYAVESAIQILTIGAHAPGDLYGKEIPYEVAMEQVRGQYVVNLNDKDDPEHGSLGFGEKATGLYSRRYLPIF